MHLQENYLWYIHGYSHNALDFVIVDEKGVAKILHQKRVVFD
jgi:hypothetical protein